MRLDQPYYIEKRENSLFLNGTWDFFWEERESEVFSEDKWKYKTELPNSVYWCLYEAGILPHPYDGVNSKEYHWVDEKVWYFRKKFNLNENFCGNVVICFEGVSYYCRLWVNKNLIGEHEGMFGGPCADIGKYLNFSGENEIIVEVKACNFGKKDIFDSFNGYDGKNSQIVPWNIARDSRTSNGDFIVMGIWNDIRIEFLNTIHISRPYCYTENITEDSAELFFETEIFDGSVEELRPYFGYDDPWGGYCRAYDNGLTGAKKDKSVEIEIVVKEEDTKKVVYHSADNVFLNDFEKSCIKEAYYEAQFFSKTIRIENPKLWYPNGLGEPFLYEIEVVLKDNGVQCDKQQFKTGIRLLKTRRTAGEKYRTRWGEYSYSINGKDFFLKGLNWTPIDFLYKLDKKEYKWCLELVKNAGVQLVRVWNGGGMFETDYFYKLCDEMGIMVWQDQFLANASDSRCFSQRILEEQIAYNTYRIRNHPSLVIYCGGNEFGPYHEKNAASMFVERRVVRDLDPSRIYYDTTADRGSAHVYRDMEPVWYRHNYKHLPFLAESGIHSFPNFETLKNIVNEKESSSLLPDIASDEFQKNYPELLNHFSEYIPERVPRMFARCSQIGDVTKFTLKELCEATHVQAFEFYTLMIQSMRENYPYCGGVMPWVFKRPWATAGIQLVDGAGRPCLQYYAMKNAYRDADVCLCLKWSIIAPFERVPLKVKVFGEIKDFSEIKLTVYSPDMTVKKEYSAKTDKSVEFDDFIPDESFKDKCFVINVDLVGKEKVRSTYFLKCTSMLEDAELLNKYRTSPNENLYFKNGPWLKETIENAKKAVLQLDVTDAKKGEYYEYDILIKNTADIAAYPVVIKAKDESAKFLLSDNFMLIKPFEEKIIHVTSRNSEEFYVEAWNKK